MPTFDRQKNITMATYPECSFKSRADMQAVRRNFNRNMMVGACIGAGAFFGGLIIDTICAVLFSKKPITSFLNSDYGLLFLFLFATIFVWFFGKSEFYKRVIENVGRANLIVMQFYKAEFELEHGIKQRNVERVTRGIARLEGLEPSFSEMPEYNELLAKGRAWLSEHQEK